MRKFGKESTAPAEKGADRDSGNGWLSGHRCALILGVIVIVAFLLRFVLPSPADRVHNIICM